MNTAATTETRQAAQGAAFTWARRHVLSSAMTVGFHAGFTVSAALLAAAALLLLREDGRGQRVSLVELQTASA